MNIKKMSVSKIILLLVLINLIQFLGYVSFWPRLLVVTVPNETTAIAHARTMLRSWEIPTEGFVFTGEFSWRARGWWVITVSPEDNIDEITHLLGFSALRGWADWGYISFDLRDGTQ